MPANPVRLAIHSHLQAAPALTALIGSRIYFQVASQDAAYPLVVFHRQSSRPRWSFAGAPLQDDLWTVLGVATGSGSASKAEEIAEAIDDALNDAELTIPGREHLLLLREEDVQYSNEDAGTLYRRAGAMYRLLSE